jgi:hypothetical protein
MIEEKDAEKSKFSCTAMHNDGVHVFQRERTIHVKGPRVRLNPNHVSLPLGPTAHRPPIDWAAGVGSLKDTLERPLGSSVTR